MASSPVPVRMPLSGEVLRLLPREERAYWFLVHGAAGRHRPCLREFCPLCAAMRHPGRLRWRGYVLCAEQDRPEGNLVAELTPGCWRGCRVLRDPSADLRWWGLTLTRLWSSGQPSIRCDEWPVDTDPRPEGRALGLCLPTLLRAWCPDDATPDYRRALYEHLQVYEAPSAIAPSQGFAGLLAGRAVCP